MDTFEHEKKMLILGLYQFTGGAFCGVFKRKTIPSGKPLIGENHLIVCDEQG